MSISRAKGLKCSGMSPYVDCYIITEFRRIAFHSHGPAAQSNILFEPEVIKPRSFATSVFVNPHDVIYKRTLVFKNIGLS